MEEEKARAAGRFAAHVATAGCAAMWAVGAAVPGYWAGVTCTVWAVALVLLAVGG